ncbi:MAG TPA: hypothetical protein VK464_24485, partial [Symbiobacteriaceae bacterium]|nr:hypothetical protein [Symbiobacteriaceae bacterium]
CTGCGLCQTTCPARAMGQGERVSVRRFLAAEPEVLVTGSTATCACGATYWQVLGGPVQCMACRMRAGGWD